MANQEHLDLVKQGVEVWNQWREDHPHVEPDLSGANLDRANLNKANLCGADLSDAHLREADLIEAHLDEANLIGADLSRAHLREANLNSAHLGAANLSRADLRKASLCEADLNRATLDDADLVESYLIRADLNSAHFNDANLNDANLSGASLRGAHFNRANLSGADLSWTLLDEAHLIEANLSQTQLGNANLSRAHLDLSDLSRAIVWSTIFGDINLSLVKGLETIDHRGPSTLGIDTIYRSQGNIPEVFLRGTGVLDSFITYMRSLISQPIDYFSCFISYSSRDDVFAKRLYADLQANGVRCWFAPEDLKIGDKIRPRIDESIHLHDKLLLVLSQHSVASQWVEQEVETTLARERKENRTVLFPIRLDKAVMKIEGGWSALIRNTRNIGDFTRWKQHDAYQKALDRLLRDLRAES